MFYSLTYLSSLRVNGENIKTVFYIRRVENKKTNSYLLLLCVENKNMKYY